MDCVALVFQRHLEDIQKTLLIVDSENAIFWAAITGSRASGTSTACQFLLETTAIRMATKDTITKRYRMLTTVGVFHQAIGEIESFPQMPSQTPFRVWKLPLIADRVVRH